MTEVELIEQLADKEHESWSRWMRFVFTSRATRNDDGSVTIPAELVERWWRQVQTPYAKLSDVEKQSDRDEVAHILPIIQRYAGEIADGAVQYEKQVSPEGLERMLLMLQREIESAMRTHGPMHSHHEAYGVLMEEVTEYFAEVMKKQPEDIDLRAELIQIAAVAVRTANELT